MKEKGGPFRVKSVTHNAVWPPHNPNRKYLDMCVRERERNGKPSSLCTLVCGWKHLENISGCMNHISAQCLLPVSSFSSVLSFLFYSAKVQGFHGWWGGCEAPLWFLENLSSDCLHFFLASFQLLIWLPRHKVLHWQSLTHSLFFTGWLESEALSQLT